MLSGTCCGDPRNNRNEETSQKASEGEDWEETEVVGDRQTAPFVFLLQTVAEKAQQPLGPQPSLETPRIGMIPEFPLQVDVWQSSASRSVTASTLHLYFIVWPSILKQDPRKECSKQAFTQVEGHPSQPFSSQSNFPWSDGETETRL